MPLSPGRWRQPKASDPRRATLRLGAERILRTAGDLTQDHYVVGTESTPPTPAIVSSAALRWAAVRAVPVRVMLPSLAVALTPGGTAAFAANASLATSASLGPCR
jgi:hypothetical protein